ncbi:hypothetical protein C1H46_007772 [Malus baccata]|uniref:Peptidase A2 domain-containing protein n=1 Tax=Malus baccata TaxID=106549 RepID=A0A540N7R8_MALBA|nr:hypothetical protein C1H46_007772 [Malus baccata]
MGVDTDPFPTATVNMVDACLPKDKGKGKAEAVTTQRFRTQNSQPRFMADFRSNAPPTALTGPAIVKPMMDYTTDEDSGTAVLCRKCRTKVESESEEKPPSVGTEQPVAATRQNVANIGPQGVFNRLGPKVRKEETPPIRRRLDFDDSFYDDDYYKRNSSSSESSRSQKTFKPPEPKDQRWDARLQYQEQVQALTPRALSSSTLPEAVAQDQQLADAAPPNEAVTEGTEESCCPALTATKSVVADQPSDEGIDPMGPSVLDNMEISMVHVLPADFQSRTAQPNFLDGDVVAEEPGHIDFVSIAEGESATKDEGLKAALAELFPWSSSAKLHHLKPLYVTAHIEGYPVSKVFVDCGATVNIMPLSIMKALRRSNDELIPSGITMSSFVGDKSQTKGVLPLTVNIAGRTHMTAFFVVDSKTEYNALLGRDWIHQTSCIPSSLYQVLVFWDGKSVTVHPADSQPFEANMIQARYYDDHVGYITLQGFNEDGRPTRISVQKAIEVGAETVHQDSARLGLANFLPESDV